MSVSEHLNFGLAAESAKNEKGLPHELNIGIICSQRSEPSRGGHDTDVRHLTTQFCTS